MDSGRVTKLAALIATTAAVAASAPSAIAATTYTVDRSDDPFGAGGCTATAHDCSLRQAIGHATTAGDGVLIPASVGKITLARGQLVVDDQNIGILGAGPDVTEISGNDATRVFLLKGNGSPSLSLTGLAVTHGKITSSGANAGGAGIRNESASGTLSLTNVKVFGNSATITGGQNDQGGAGIWSIGLNLTISSSRIVTNTASIGSSPLAGSSKGGAGLWYGGNGDVTISNSQISHNVATITGSDTLGGGGIMNAHSAQTPKLTVTESEVADNHANITTATTGAGGNSGGGGIFDDNGDNAAITRSLVSENVMTASGGDDLGGGGIFMGQGAMTLDATTVALNNTHVSSTTDADTAGGALHNVRVLQNSTIASNITNVDGGGWVNTTTAVPIATNTIFFNNSCRHSSSGSNFSSGGHNMDNFATCGGTGPGDVQGVNPKLGALANNGGPTRTMALLPGSPAVNTGADCGTLDQRHVQRPQGAACDRGAFEALAGKPIIVATGPAKKLRLTTALLTGRVNPHAFSTSYHFEYGLTTSYGKSTPTKPAGFGNGPVLATGGATGLTPGTKYHFRLVATNFAGTVKGPDRTFTTPRCTLVPLSAKPVQGKLSFKATCAKASSFKLSGVFTQKNPTKTFQATPVTGQLAANTPKTVKLAVPQPVLTALSNGKTVSGSFTLTAGAVTAHATIKQLQKP